ncbi:MAG: molybdenum cofactor guanylyltransferase [Deltaproteobacteria bacterium]|nr:molybdenum cofactor guanylyltransferase [Deltaproteobacteria bacterium]
MTGVILSGGKCSRMGANKAFLTVEGERLIDRTVRLFRKIFDEVIIVTTAPEDYLDQDAAIVTDILPEKRALGGIYTGLFWARSEQAFFAACDMPFLNRDFIEYMVGLAAGQDIVVPLCPEGPQALHAIYSRRCLPVIRGLIDRNKLKITGLYPGHTIRQIPIDTIRSFDPEARMFINVNTPEDLRNLPAC